MRILTMVKKFSIERAIQVELPTRALGMCVVVMGPFNVYRKLSIFTSDKSNCCKLHE